MWLFPSTGKQLAATALCFATGAALFAVGAHLSYTNVAPQQARAKVRSDVLREHLLRKYGYMDEKYTEDPPVKTQQ